MRKRETIQKSIADFEEVSSQEGTNCTNVEYCESTESSQRATIPVQDAEDICNTKKSIRRSQIQEFFSARRMAYISVFTALSFALRFLQFAILPAVPYLKFDFSDAIVLICAYALGPVAGIISGVAKEVIYGICFTQSAFVGELANIIILIPFILIPSIVYKKHKGIKSVVLWLAVACVVRTLWSFPINLFLNFPVFLGFNWEKGMSMFLQVWYWAMLFNLIKNVILAVVVMLLYKSVSRFIHILNDKFDRLHERRNSNE